MQSRLIEVQSVSLYLEGKELFYGVSFDILTKDRLGLLGANGAGKSSLLNILAGKLKASDGRIIKSPGSSLHLLSTELPTHLSVWDCAKTSLKDLQKLEQQIRVEEEKMAADSSSLDRYARLTAEFERKDGYKAEQNLKRHLTEFGFPEARFAQKLESLSGGERMRLALAMALGQQADILLLDEPSNHLDIKMKRYLQNRLKAYEGAILLASHDRALLNAVCKRSLSFENGKLELYKGNYDAFKVQQAQKQQSNKTRLREKQRLEQSLTATKQAANYQKAEKRRKKLLTALTNFEGTEESKQQNKALKSSSRSAKGLLYAAKHLSTRHNQKVILDNEHMQVYAADKIGLIGKNASGKTTLLKLIAGEASSDNPKVEQYWHNNTKLFYYDQHQRGLNDTPIKEQLGHLVSEERAKMLLALVDLDESHWHKTPNKLSSGQRARAGIAKMIASEANFILLDEPSNALDLNMIERLEQSLKDSKAALIIASHDEMLLQSVCKRIWSIEDAKLTEYRGGIEGFFKGNKQVKEEAILKTELPKAQETESYEAKKERLELERVTLENALLDPKLLSERELERSKQRLAELMHELSEHYDNFFPEPRPSFQASFSDILVSSNGFKEHTCHFETAAPISIIMQRDPKEKIANIALKYPEDSCLLNWAKEAILKSIVQISFEHLDITAIQLQDKLNLGHLGFQAASANWWLQQRSYYERQLGFSKTASHKPKRNKRKRHVRKRQSTKTPKGLGSSQNQNQT